MSIHYHFVSKVKANQILYDIPIYQHNYLKECEDDILVSRDGSAASMTADDWPSWRSRTWSSNWNIFATRLIRISS